MGREVKRVPIGFDWPLNEVWAGFVTPEWLREKKCPDCENGYGPEAQRMHSEWYGYESFNPASTGSRPFTVETPEVRAFAERNVRNSPDFYGSGESAVVREAERLLSHWNGMWMHHLAQIDVDALIEAGRLMDFTHRFEASSGWVLREDAPHPTAEQVNAWSLRGFGHDSINAGVAIRARCEREGFDLVCATCKGHASLPKFKGQRKLAKKWKAIKPPTGEWWQLWETVSEGSPVSPAFETPEELAAWINPADPAASLEWVTGAGWAPSMTVVGGVVATSSDYAEGNAKF